MTYRVIISARVRAAIKNTARYIAQDSPERAEEWTTQTYVKLFNLGRNPYAKPPAPEDRYTGTDVRRITLSKNYLAWFTVDEEKKRVLVIRFLHARQNI